MMNLVRLLSLALLLSAAQQAPAAFAQEPTSTPSATADDSIAAMTEGLTEAILAMTRDMHGIVSEIETVEDVQEADEEIGEIFDELVENMRGAMKYPAALQAMETEMESDPEVMEWTERMEATMETLQTDHPEAAAELERVMQKHSMKLMALMSETMQSMSPEEIEELEMINPEDIEGETEMFDPEEIERETETVDPYAGTVETADFDADEIRASMLELNEAMYEIISGIESVEDVQAADEKIGEIFEELTENMRAGMQNPTEMQKMEMEMQADPKMQEWDQKINAAMETLKSEHPEAAAELDRVMQKHAGKMQQMMMEAAQ